MKPKISKGCHIALPPDITVSISRWKGGDKLIRSVAIAICPLLYPLDSAKSLFFTNFSRDVTIQAIHPSVIVGVNFAVFGI